jgi:hypothetical protein
VKPLNPAAYPSPCSSVGLPPPLPPSAFLDQAKHATVGDAMLDEP